MDRPKVGIGVFVWRDGKFLVMKRSGAHGQGTWTVPGGHLEFKETWEQCAKREVLEETGMEITNIRLLAATNDIFEKENKHYNTIWIESDWLRNEPQNLEPKKCTDLQWATFTSLPSPLFNPPWKNLMKTRPELFSNPSQQG